MVSPSTPRKPVDAKPQDTKPRDGKPREEKPREEKPREDKPGEVKPRDNDRPADEGASPTVRPDRDDRPVVRTPSTPKSPDTREPRGTEPGRTRPSDTKTPSVKPTPVTPTTAKPDSGKPEAKPRDRAPRDAERGRGGGNSGSAGGATVVGDTVFGVPVARGRDLGGGRGNGARDGEPGRGDRHDDRDRGPGRGGDDVTIYNDNRTYTQYVTNISRCNGWSGGSRWADCGPCHTWDRYDCHDGVSVAIGFGSGFSFGFFYGSSCAPLCTSWCNPWWEGYACSWSVAPYSCGWRPWYRPGCAWVNPCRPWWHTWYACGPCPVPAWTPCYSYYPYGATYVYAPVVTAPPVIVPTLPNPDALWTYLAEGYDRDAEDGFILLESADPNDARWVAGQAVVRAFRSDTVRAATLLREALALDGSVMTQMSQDRKFVARLEALERALEPAAIAPQPSIDALLVMAAVQAARGDVQAAYLNATTAEAEGDRSAGTASFISWLRAELRRRP